MIFKVRGNRELGYSIAVPTEAYNNADHPKEYDNSTEDAENQYAQDEYEIWENREQYGIEW